MISRLDENRKLCMRLRCVWGKRWLEFLANKLLKLAASVVHVVRVTEKQAAVVHRNGWGLRCELVEMSLWHNHRNTFRLTDSCFLYTVTGAKIFLLPAFCCLKPLLTFILATDLDSSQLIRACRQNCHSHGEHKVAFVAQPSQGLLICCLVLPTVWFL